MRHTKLLIGLLSIAMITSCNNDNDDEILLETCNFSNPSENLEWLKNKINEFENPDLPTYEFNQAYTYLTLSQKDGNAIFILADCCPHCLSISPVYSCEGEVIGALGDDNYSFDLLEKSTLVWKSKNSLCTK